MIRLYRFISEHRAEFGVQRLCAVLKVRRQGFYEWLAGESARAERTECDRELASVITEIHSAHCRCYGRPRITWSCSDAAWWSTQAVQTGHARARRGHRPRT
ncbi:hypothetical protein LFM09_47185 [Lentzea alba]|uniref:hypothetical protein n=1 Tax=Lentzea alba TaxID=2714351 RepID=UPI0039BF6557